ncbi:ammonium Transporter family protein, partial [Vibrio parahaemolyticus VPTS-2010_2]
MSVTA